MITIEPVQLHHLAQVQALLNAHMSAVVPGWTLSEAFIAGLLERNPGEYIVDPWVIARTTLCAIERQRVVAAAHVLRYGTGPEVSADLNNIGDIDWFVAWPRADAAAAALLTAVQQQCVAWGVREQWVEGGLLVGPFSGVPDVWPHIAAALRTAGYQPSEDATEMVYGGRIDHIPPPGEPPLLGLNIQRSAGQFGTCFIVTHDCQWVGHCEVVIDMTEGNTLPALRGWAELAEVDILPEWQRRGIGTWLVQHAVEWLRFGRCDRIVLAVTFEAEALGADRFYRRFGWNRLVRQQKGWTLDKPQ